MAGSGGTLTPAQCKSILKEVAPMVEGILKRHIQTDIYDAYKPQNGGWMGHGKLRFESAYKRRHKLGEKVKSKIVTDADGATLRVTSTETENEQLGASPEAIPEQDGGFLWAIENGFDGKGNWGLWDEGFSRPALSNAQRDVDSSTAIRKAIEAEINKRIG